MAGGFVRLTVAGKVFIQPEALFSQDRSQIEMTALGLEELQDMRLNKLDIPVMVGFKMGKIFRIQGGPVASYVLDAAVNSPNSNGWESIKDGFDNKTWGYQAGIGLDMGPVTLDLKYEGSLRKIRSEMQVGNETFQFDHRESIFQATLGWKIF